MQKKLRVFLDTSALLAGLNSPTGAAGVIISACFARQIIPIISPQIIEEADRNIALKFPGLITAWQSFLLIPPRITSKPSLTQIQQAYAILPTSDAPILANAIAVKPDALITWNTKDFLRKTVVDSVDFRIFTPGEFLRISALDNTQSYTLEEAKTLLHKYIDESAKRLRKRLRAARKNQQKL